MNSIKTTIFSKKRVAVFLLAVFSTALMSSCVHAPKQAWTPKYKSYKLSKKKK
ncbi:hypothetical protein [Bernardetia sp.]|uniref:hypothetical protein n=1 Tax=Bernardetia sp. TaxID=1937974 RepID=UPI0025C2D12C|nr:hypothetical protein [Bernardetia sp.]